MNRRSLIKGAVGLCGLILTGCTTIKPSFKTSPLTEGQIRRLFESRNIQGFSELVFDNEYSSVSIEWLQEVYFPLLKAEINKYELEYKRNSFDCEDFATLAVTIATRLNAKTKNNEFRGIGVGIFCYVKGAEGNHAINFAIVRNSNNELDLVFIEPQNPRIVELSKKEQESCLAWII